MDRPQRHQASAQPRPGLTEEGRATDSFFFLRRGYTLYLERCRAYLASPPEPGRLGAYHHTTKSLRAMSSPIALTTLSDDASGFTAFTFHGLAGRLARLAYPWFAIGLTLDDVPIGLALGEVIRHEAILRSIRIDPQYRRRGFAAQLLRAWEAKAEELGVEKLRARYSDALAQRAAFESLLARANWPAPGEESFRITGYAGRMGREGGSWAGVRQRILRSGELSYGPLELRPYEEQALANMLAQPQAVNFGDPRRFTNRIPDLSLAIRRKGDLIGWIVATPGAEALKGRHSCTLVDYKECYLDVRLWQTGAALGAFYRCFLRQAEMYGEGSIASYMTDPVMANMVAFTRRRFAPMAISFRTVLCAVKEDLGKL